MEIKYKIDFFSEWHCGSGLSAGADVDALVIKDRNGLPFVPGKTMKGLLRETVEELVAFRGLSKSLLVTLFGNSADRNNKDGGLEVDTMQQGKVYLTDAVLAKEHQLLIKQEHLQEFLFNTVSATRLTDEGVAQEHSLRRIQTVLPCVLYGEILDIPTPEMKQLLIDGLSMIKRLGVGRNRGLGRCLCTTDETKEGGENESPEL